MSLTSPRAISRVVCLLAAVLTCQGTASPGSGSGLNHVSALPGTVAYSQDEDIWVSNPDGSHRRRLTALPGPEDDPSWSPDGRRVVYRDSRRGYNNNDEIYIVDADGRHRRNLTRYPGNDWSPSWSRANNLIAYSSDLQLYVIHPNGTGRRRITNVEAEYPAWSPDGKRLAFMSAQAGTRAYDPNYDVFVVNLDGSHLRQLTSWPGEDGWPAWSPDGKMIAFTTTHDHDGWPGLAGLYRDIWIMRPDGSAKRRLIRHTAGEYPVWSPDGKTIMFDGSSRSRPEQRLWVAKPDGTEATPLPIRGELADWIATRR
jgi:Tol biopolymer transport system component